MSRTRPIRRTWRKCWDDDLILCFTGQRIRKRGDVDRIGRALFLKEKPGAMPENQGHIDDTPGNKAEDAVPEIAPEQYRMRQSPADRPVCTNTHFAWRGGSLAT